MPCSPPGDLPYPGIKPGSPTLPVDSLPSEPPGKLIPLNQFSSIQCLSCVQLFATSWAVAHQAPLSMEILQARILEWVAMPSSRGSSKPKDRTQIFHTAGGFFTTELSSLTRDQTCASCLGSTRVLSTGLLRKSNKKFFNVPFHFKA